MADRPPLPDPLPLPVTDNHTHLDHLRGAGPGVHPTAEQVQEALQRARSVNVTRLVQIGCDLPAARWTLAQARQLPELIAGVALHPTEASAQAAAGTLDAALDEIELLASDPAIAVVGETGLDHYWVQDQDGRAAQELSFRRHIDLAKRQDKVLQVHDRDAHEDVLRVLLHEGAPVRTVIHCFSGDADLARRCADQGWYLSFAGPVTFRNGGALREALAAVPFEQVLVETDAPYLTPHPHRGAVNAAYLLPLTVRTVAEVAGLDLTQACATLAATSERLYGRD